MIQPLDDLSLGAQPDLAAIIARDAAWLSELEGARSAAAVADPRSLGRYGPREGLLALEDSGSVVYAQSARLHVSSGGRVLDDRDRAVLGYAIDPARSGEARPIQLPAVARGRTVARYEVDDRGLILGVLVPDGSPSEPIPLARVAVALFPAPARLVKTGEVLTRTRSAGAPLICPADAPNVGGLLSQPTDALTSQLEAQARQAYAASAQAELQVALSSSRDALVRVALDVVK